MIPRLITSTLQRNLTQFPIVSVTGPRQSGKTTLLKHTFTEFDYVSLEDPDVRTFAEDDPRSFLRLHSAPLIIDEAQRVPSIFSYLQGKVDESNQLGQYIISGSQNFLLMESISQSLAGRVAIRHLLPFSYQEILNAEDQPATIADWVFRGGYPRLYSSPLNPDEYFPSYLQTYVDRDVRQQAGVIKVPEFNRFLTLCATRIGSLLNLSSLANECDIDEKTAQKWLSLLEQSFVIYLLRPYSKNLGKRLVKTPKLYFYDTGFASSLLGLETTAEMQQSTYWGKLFENAVLMEQVKQAYASGKSPHLYFWRDSNKQEIDILETKGEKIVRAIEVKSSSTYQPKYFTTLDTLGTLLNVPEQNREIVYSGSETFETKHGKVTSFKDCC